jgi:hypothetical protein
MAERASIATFRGNPFGGCADVTNRTGGIWEDFVGDVQAFHLLAASVP